MKRRQKISLSILAILVTISIISTQARMAIIGIIVLFAFIYLVAADVRVRVGKTYNPDYYGRTKDIHGRKVK